MKSMREEILRNQDYQQHLNRWKVILVSSLFAIGIGLGAESKFIKAYYLLLGIPFVCIYVDLLYYQTTLRIFWIANFIRTFCGTDHEGKNIITGEDLIVQKYEAFIHNVRTFQLKGIFEFGRVAQYGSSVIFTIFLTGFGALFYFQQMQGEWGITLFLFLGIIIVGVFAHIFLYRKFRRLLGDLNYLHNPIVGILDDDEDGGLPRDMVSMINKIGHHNRRLLLPLCMESFSWSGQEEQEKGRKKLEKIMRDNNIEHDGQS